MSVKWSFCVGTARNFVAVATNKHWKSCGHFLSYGVMNRLSVDVLVLFEKMEREIEQIRTAPKVTNELKSVKSADTDAS